MANDNTDQNSLNYWMKKTGGNKKAGYTLYKRHMQANRRGASTVKQSPAMVMKSDSSKPATPPRTPRTTTPHAVGGARGMTDFQASGKHIDSGWKHAGALIGGVAAPLAVPAGAAIGGAIAAAPGIAAATGSAAAGRSAANTVRGLTPSARSAAAAARTAKLARDAKNAAARASRAAKKATKDEDLRQKGETAAAEYTSGALGQLDRRMH